MDKLIKWTYDLSIVFMKGTITMKKLFPLFALALTFGSEALALEEIKLPAPDTKGGIPLMEAISRRQTVREFSQKAIDDQTLSEILYVAWGISHDGKRTVPTGRDMQNMRLFAARKDGVWEYDAETNSIKKVSDIDTTPYLAKQDFVETAPLTLIFTGTDSQYSPMAAASAYQNVGLYCASRGLNNVVRGYFDRPMIAKVLGMEEDDVIITQTIGWPNM